MGTLSFWYVWATGIRKKLINLTFKKRKIFRGGWNWPIFSFIFWGVAYPKFNFLSHFLINLQNSCAYLGANFLNFPKHPQLFKFWCFWMKLCKKQGKSALQKMGQFEPPPKIFLFLKMKFINFFLIPMDQKYQNESVPIFCYAKSTKTAWNSLI